MVHTRPNPGDPSYGYVFDQEVPPGLDPFPTAGPSFFGGTLWGSRPQNLPRVSVVVSIDQRG